MSNLKGEFNVPVGSKAKIVYDYDDFSGASAALKSVEIRASDFEAVIDEADEHDFLFVDPPYTVKHNFNGFLKYNKSIFSWEDQERLFEALVRASGRGCYIAATNADHETVRALYEGCSTYHQVFRTSTLASESVRRTCVTEALFTFNY